VKPKQEALRGCAKLLRDIWRTFHLGYWRRGHGDGAPIDEIAMPTASGMQPKRYDPGFPLAGNADDAELTD